MADHEQEENRDDGQDGEEQPEINRQRPMDDRVSGIARGRHLDGIPVNRRC